jgi:hypothetical protein
MQLLLAVSMVKSDSARRGWQERVGFLFSGTGAISLSVHGWSWLWYFDGEKDVIYMGALLCTQPYSAASVLRTCRIYLAQL